MSQEFELPRRRWFSRGTKIFVAALVLLAMLYFAAGYVLDAAYGWRHM